MAWENSFNPILRGRHLFHQLIVDMYVKVESERLRYGRFNQARLRADDYTHLRDAMRNDADPTEIGRRVIFPSSFTGGPRYMKEKTQDAMTYVREKGRPQLFIPFTCKVNPQTRQSTNKKVSANEFYAFRVMARENSFNPILSGRHLFHQFIVDMYVKVESEHLRYDRFNQARLRADDYIHLRDAITAISS